MNLNISEMHVLKQFIRDHRNTIADEIRNSDIDEMAGEIADRIVEQVIKKIPAYRGQRVE